MRDNSILTKPVVFKRANVMRAEAASINPMAINETHILVTASNSISPVSTDSSPYNVSNYNTAEYMFSALAEP